jgi:hypothetical protein
MGAQANPHTDEGQQLALYKEPRRGAAYREKSAQRTRPAHARSEEHTRMCAACRAREARYGFNDRPDDDPLVGRPNTLCFDCFRMEIDRRQAVTAQLARGWNATQASLPLGGTLEALDRRRRRAQIAARHALELR